MALLRGAVFELTYGSSMFEPTDLSPTCNSTQNFISNSLQLAKHSKGKGIILSSNTDRKVFMRSPIDLIYLAQTLSLSPTQSRQALTTTCLQAFRHAHCRKTHLGAAEVKWLSEQDLRILDESDSEEEGEDGEDQEME